MKRNLYLFKFFNNLQSQNIDALVILHAKEGNYYQLKQLLDNGANANAKENDGRGGQQ